jgi:hypothetical protein
MKNSFFAVLLFLPALVHGQYTDDFSDGDLQADPAWTGQVEKFTVSSGELELRDTSRTGSAYLATFSSASGNAAWEFYHRYLGNPSSGNRAEYYLISDRPDLSGPLNGYYIRIGEQTGTTDRIRLFRQQGTESSEILATEAGTVLNGAGEVTIRVRVTRDDTGNWRIWSDAEGGVDFQDLGSVKDNVINFSLFSGVKVRYSGSRSEGFYFFDDFHVTGEGPADTTAPGLLSLTVLSPAGLELKFSEALDPASAADVTNYIVNNDIGLPGTAVLRGADAVVLAFAVPFTDGRENELSISGVADISGNVALMGKHPFTYYEAVPASFNDVVITEIHAHPAAFTAMPDAEFIEIHNPTEKAFQLEGWTLQDGSQNGRAEFPSRIIAPGSFTILCDIQFVGLFSGFGEVIGLDGLPSLNNSGDDLMIRDVDGALIFHTAYMEDWYRDNIKSEGGWSLEMIDAARPCLGAENWKASNDPSGGTPGMVNSAQGVLSDGQRISLSGIEVRDSITIHLLFSEKIDIGNLSSLAISVNGGLADIADYTVVEPGVSEIIAVLPSPMQPNVVYEVMVNMLFDCHGNVIGPENRSRFGLPLPVGPGDLVINEILFDPFAGNVDYIELYNSSSRILTTADLIIAEADASDPETVVDFASLGESARLIFPYDHFVLTASKELVQAAYFTPSPGNFLEVPDMPNYPDDQGVVILLREDLEPLDRVVYSDEWHYALIDDKNGVSLERIDISRESQDADNWHSASSAAGFGTPARLNSATIETGTSDRISIEPRVFSPDNDGYHDFTVISYEFEDQDYMANIRIFDTHGREVCHLVRNETIGSTGFFKWDGTDGNGERVRTGLYIVLVELFDLESRPKKYSLEVALTTG